jgi:adenylate cyclase
MLINRLGSGIVRRRLRIGIGINTGVVIAGTTGGAGKLEFTLIGATVNVAARVEQLTKTTGDTILSITKPSTRWLLNRPAASPTGDHTH